MRKRSPAAAMNARIVFQRRVEIDDGYGGTRGDWVDQFDRPARLQPKFGGNAERLVAARLESQQPYNLTVYSCSSTRQITPAWRAYDARAGLTEGVPNRVFGIKSIVNPDENNALLEMLVFENDG